MRGSGRSVQLGLAFSGRVEKREEQKRREQRETHRHKEQPPEIRHAVFGENRLQEVRTDRIGGERADAQNHHVEQPLGAGAGVLREMFIHEDIDRGEEKRVADAVQYLDEDDQFLLLRTERINPEPRA